MTDVVDLNSKRPKAATVEDVMEHVKEQNPVNAIVIYEYEGGMLGMASNGLSLSEINLYLDMTKQSVLAPGVDE